MSITMSPKSYTYLQKPKQNGCVNVMLFFCNYMSVARLTKKQRVSNDRLGKINSRKSLDINTIKNFSLHSLDMSEIFLMV